MDPLSSPAPGAGPAEEARRATLAAVAGQVRSGSRVLVAGADIGELCRRLKEEHRCEVDGYELNVTLAESAAPWCRQLGSGSPGALLEGTSATPAYDAVLCHGLFERLAAPEPVLVRLKSALGSQGRLVVLLPNAAYAGALACLAAGELRYPETAPAGEALRLYTLRSFITMLESQGWEVGAVDARRLAVADSEFADCLGRLEPPVRNYLLGRGGADIQSAVFTARPAEGEPRHFERSPEPAAVPDSSPLSEAVDIVIPLVSGPDTVRRCLESLLDSTPPVPVSIICVSTDRTGAGVRSYVGELAGAGRVTFIDGGGVSYTDAANLGLMNDPDRDVVLLDDTVEVSGSWLERLRRAAGSSPLAATASPFSGNGIYCAYPRMGRLNQLPEGESIASLDRLFEEAVGEATVEIPMAPGYCTYIRRSALKRTGYLDALHFGHGYGAVLDLSLRAMLKGYRHLLAGVYVASSREWHAGGERERKRQDEGQMRQRHPGIQKMISEACEADPALAWRRRVDLARIAASGRPRLLMVTHALGGPVERHVQQLARLLEPRLEVLTLYPGLAGVVMVRWERGGEEFRAGFPLPAEAPELEAFLKELGISRIHYHHLAGLPESVMRLPAALEVSYDFTVHDYYTLCPRFDLLRPDGAYCGEPELTVCNACRAEAPVASFEEIRDWRQRHAAFLGGAERVFALSQDALARMRRYFPDAPLVHLPPPDDWTGRPPLREVKVVVPAAEITPAARALVEDCARNARARGLPVFYRVLGREEAQPATPSLSYSGPVAPGFMAAAIERECADVIFLAAVGPATDIEALAAAGAAGPRVLAPRLGVIEEFLAGRPEVELFEPGTPAAAINDRIMELSVITTASAHED